MKHGLNAIQALMSTRSRKEKEAIIAENKDNTFFTETLHFLLNPYITTGISTKKWNAQSVLDFEMNANIEDIVKVYEYLKQNNTGKIIDVRFVKSFAENFKDDDVVYEFVKGVVTKTLRLGVDAKTVNKVIPGLIPSFQVMKGIPFVDAKLNGDEWLSISQKLNGTRCVYVGDKLLTCSGKEYTGLEHVIEDCKWINIWLRNTICDKDWVLDGELVYGNEEGLSDSEAFQKGTGIAMSKDTDKRCMRFVIFDVLPLEEFEQGITKSTYKERLEVLKSIKNYCREFVRVVDFLYHGTDHTEIQKGLDYAEEHDWEGVMVNLDTPYQCKRVDTLIKVKKFKTCDIRCIGIEEGTGRNKGVVGALLCDYKGNNVKVGSGLSDEQRKRWFENPEEVVGWIVTVKYKEETKNKNGGMSIQFPVFDSIRWDKDEESYN